MKEALVTLEEDLVQLTDRLQQEAQSIPNITHPDVPIGGEESSIVRKMVFKFFSACADSILAVRLVLTVVPFLCFPRLAVNQNLPLQ